MTGLRFAEAGVGHVAADPAEERKAGAFHGGLHPGFDEGERLQGIARDEALVTELDEPVGNVRGIQPEFLSRGTVFPITGTSACPAASCSTSSFTQPRTR